MSDWESAEHRNAEFAQLIAQHVDKGPFPPFGFGRANELPDRDASQAFEATGTSKLGERAIDLPDEVVDRFDEENRFSETGAGPPNCACNGAEVPADQETGCRAFYRDERRAFIAILKNYLRFGIHQGVAEVNGRTLRKEVWILGDMRPMKSSHSAFSPEGQVQ